MPDKPNQPSKEGADFKAEAKPETKPEKDVEAEMKAATEEIIKKSDELNVTIVAYLETSAQGIVPRVAVVPKQDGTPTDTKSASQDSA